MNIPSGFFPANFLTLEKGNTSTSLMDMLLSKKRAGDRKHWLETKGDLANLNE